MLFLLQSADHRCDGVHSLRVLCGVMAIAVSGRATLGESVERGQGLASSSLVRSFEQLVKATSVAVPDAPAILLHAELPQRSLVLGGAAGPGVATAGAHGGSVRVASNTKTFVAATLRLLSERGRIEIDAPAARGLLPLTANAMHGAGYDLQRITVRMLLQHTSGLRDHRASGPTCSR